MKTYTTIETIVISSKMKLFSNIENGNHNDFLKTECYHDMNTQSFWVFTTERSKKTKYQTVMKLFPKKGDFFKFQEELIRRDYRQLCRSRDGGTKETLIIPKGTIVEFFESDICPVATALNEQFKVAETAKLKAIEVMKKENKLREELMAKYSLQPHDCHGLKVSDEIFAKRAEEKKIFLKQTKALKKKEEAKETYFKRATNRLGDFFPSNL